MATTLLPEIERENYWEEKAYAHSRLNLCTRTVIIFQLPVGYAKAVFRLNGESNFPRSSLTSNALARSLNPKVIGSHSLSHLKPKTEVNVVTIVGLCLWL